MIFVTWNINGLRGYQKQYDLREFLEKYEIDILQLQETKLQADWDIQKGIDLGDEWHVYQHTASCRKGYAGVATLSKMELEPLSITMPNDRFQSEGRMLAFGYQDLKLVNIYFPQGDRTKKDVPYKLEVCDFLQKMVQEKPGDWIIAGDYNMAHQDMDLARPKQNRNNNMFTPEEREHMSRWSQIGMIDVFRERYPQIQRFTWWPYAYDARERDIGWRLDYIFVSESLWERVRRAEILKEVPGSDHCPVLMEIDVASGI